MGKLCRFTDLSGRVFGSWSVSGTFTMRGRHVVWLCECECGKLKEVFATNLTSGKSLGCKACRATRHGKTRTPEHLAWMNMTARCTRKQHPEYADYGGRGIAVCERWKTFENFLEDMGSRPDYRMSLGRIDNNLGYCPSNCRWETAEQQHNNKRNNVVVEFSGMRKTLSQWCRSLNIPYGAVQRAIRTGLSAAAALKLLSNSTTH